MNRSLIFSFFGRDVSSSSTMARIGTTADVTGRKLNAAGRSLGSYMKSVGFFAAGVGAAVSVVSVKMAADFQTALTRIHTQADASNATVAKLRTGILSMASSVATAPKVLATAAFHIASVGQKSLSTAQQLRILKIAAEGAKLGGADLVDVTNALDAAWVSGIRGAKGFSQTMGVLNAVVGAGDMTMQQMADAFGPLGATFKGYNVSIQQAGAALAVFGDNNKRGAEAGTALRMAIQSLSVPVKTGQKLLESWGIKSGTLANQLRHGGLTDALDTLYAAMKRNGVSGKEVGSVLTQTFGKKAGVGLTYLIDELSRYHLKLREVSKGATGFASSWKGYTKTFGFAFDRAKTAVETLVITLGTKLLPVATKIANYVTNHVVPALSSFGHWVKQNAGWVKPLAVALAGFAGGLIVVSKALGVARFAAGLFGVSLDVALGPVGLIIAGLTAVAAAAVYFYKTSETFRHAVQRVFVDLATVVGKWAQVNLTMLRYVADGMLSFVGTIIHAAASAFGWIPGLGGKLKGAAAAFDGFKSSVLDTLGSLATDAGNLGAMAGSLWQQGWNSGVAGARQPHPKMVAGHKIYPIGFVGPLPPGAMIGPVAPDSNTPGVAKPGHRKPSTPTVPQWNLPGGSGVPITTGGGPASSVAKTAAKTAKVLSHLSAQQARLLGTGLLSGFKGASGRLLSQLTNGLQDQFHGAETRITNGLKRFADHVKTARDKMLADLKAKRTLAAQIRDSLVGDLSGVFGQDANGNDVVANIGLFLTARLTQLKTFAADLLALRKAGLATSLLTMIANLGPAQGIQVATQIMQGTSGTIASLNTTEAGIQAAGQSVGNTVAGSTYDKRVEADRKVLRDQLDQQKEHTRLLKALIHAVLDSATTPEGLAKALRKLKHQLGHDLGLA